MTDYETREAALIGGEPVEGLEFLINSTYFRYTGADRALTINGKTFTPIALGRAAYRVTGRVERSLLEIKVPRDLAVLYTSGRNSLTIYRGHQGLATFKVVWSGRVTGVDWRNSEATIKCESILSSLQRPGLRAKYQIMCRHVLGDRRCRVDMTALQVEATVTVISGLNVTLGDLSAYDADWFFGGHMSLGPQMRTITGHNGNVIQIDRPVSGMVVTSEILLWPGCDHDMEHCQTKYANLDNYGGFPWIPPLNPFSGLGNSL